MATTDPKPLTYCNDVSRLPVALARLSVMANWVIWRWTKNDSDKWTKPPFQSEFPSRMARNNAEATWSSHAAAVEAVKHGEADGIGFALTGTDIAAIDLDHCRDPATGEIYSWAKAIIDNTASYVEVTVSGTGLRVIGTGSGEEIHTNYKIERLNGAKIEIYRRAVRYITISDLEISHCDALSNIDDLIDSLINQYNQKPYRLAKNNFKFGRRGINDLIRNGVPERHRSEIFQSVVFRLAKAGLSIDAIEAMLSEFRQKYADRLRVEIERSYSKWEHSRRNDERDDFDADHNSET